MRSGFFALVVLLAGCATASHEDRAALLAEPIDCESAEADVAALEAAMPSRGERAKSAVQSVTPIGAAAGVARGSYRDNAAVLTGRTKEQLSARIEEIRVTCGISKTTEAESN